MCVPSMSCVVFLNSLALAWRMDTRATPEALDRRSVISRRRYSRQSIAIIRIGDSVCLSERTIKPKWMKEKPSNLAHRDSPSRYLAHQLILGQKVKKSQGQKSAKSRDETAVRRRVAPPWRRSTRRHLTVGVSYALYRVLSCYSFIYPTWAAVADNTDI